jgi:hypothetical protein
MKNSILAGVAGVALIAATLAFAAPDAKEVTLSGMGKCAKCSLGTSDKCATALVVKANGTEETYLLAKNDVSEKFHKNVCEEDKPITVTGTVKEVDGKKEIVASKVELAKD